MKSEQPELPEPKKVRQSSKTKQVTEKVDKIVKSKVPQKKKAKHLSAASTAQVDEVIRQAFMRFYDKTSVRAAQNLEIKHLDNVISEYLENFILLGYDVIGQKVSVIHATSQYGKDALIEHLRTTLLGIIGVDPSGM